jgi:serine/threonine protein kinase
VARPGPRGTVWPRAMEGPELPEVRSPVRAGQVVDRKYRVDGVLGAGGMGIVVSAMHLALDEPVALKFMTHADGRGDATSRARFLREAKAARKLTSAHVARVFDVGQLPSGEPYIVMELLKGDDLARHLRVHGRLSAADTVKYVLQVCDAIREAHALGIIHRDLKPQNLFLTERPGSNPIIKVLDFGIAKSLETTAPDGALTASQGVVGSPVYMSPEQLRASKHVDERTDIWSLGVIMFELLSGKVPFVGDSVVELGMRIMTVPAPSLIELRAELPAGLADIVQRCLEKEPEKRFQTIDTLAGALKAYAEVSLRSLPASDVSHRSLPFADTLVAIVAVALLQRRDAPMDPAHAPVATATQVQVFHVDVRVDPPSASVRFDSEGASSTPFARDVPRDGRAHTLAIEADGYAPMEISFRDVPPPASVTLKPLPASPAPAPSASPPTPTSAPRHAVAPKASAAPSATPAPTQPPTTTNDSPIVR